MYSERSSYFSGLVWRKSFFSNIELILFRAVAHKNKSVGKKLFKILTLFVLNFASKNLQVLFFLTRG